MFALTKSFVKTSLEYLKGYHVLERVILFFAFSKKQRGPERTIKYMLREAGLEKIKIDLIIRVVQ